MRLPRLLLVAVSAAAAANLAFAFAWRVAYPYDLEWMEGAMLCHALRLVQGLPIYAEPSGRFVSFAYTPLYPTALGLLAPLLGLDYLPARAVSVAAFLGALFAVHRFVRREGASHPVALGAAALPAAAFGPTGAWYDLARVDSLFLGLVAAAVTIGGGKGKDTARAVTSAVLMTMAFFAKQTALPFAAALVLALALARRRAALHAAVLTVLGGALLAWAHMASEGWFWTYVFGLHRRHAFDLLEAAIVTPARLLLLLGPGVFLVGWALLRARTPAVLFTAGMAATGILASALGAGTQWAYHNALIPGVYFIALAAGVAAAALESRHAAAAALLLAAAVATGPGGLVALAAQALPETWRVRIALPLGYDLRSVLPARSDRARGDALIARLAAAPGDVFVPAHSFYPHLAGKTTRVHAVNLADLEAAGMRVPRDLVDEVRQKRFSLVVVDREVTGAGVDDPAARVRQEEEAIGLVPALSKHYQMAERIDGPRVFSGGAFEPCCVLEPRAEPSDPVR